MIFFPDVFLFCGAACCTGLVLTFLVYERLEMCKGTRPKSKPLLLVSYLALLGGGTGPSVTTSPVMRVPVVVMQSRSNKLATYAVRGNHSIGEKWFERMRRALHVPAIGKQIRRSVGHRLRSQKRDEFSSSRVDQFWIFGFFCRPRIRMVAPT